MSESIKEFIFSNNKWKNIEYDFSGHSNNCTLNIYIGYMVNIIKLTKSLFEIQSNHFYNVFIPLISQATKCKIFISNFKYPKPEIELENLRLILVDDNVS